MMINGNIRVLAHIGFPTHSFKAPLIYNPWSMSASINVVVVPMACQSEHYESFLKAVFNLENLAGALITMPHKITTRGLLDSASSTVAIAGACNDNISDSGS